MLLLILEVVDHRQTFAIPLDLLLGRREDRILVMKRRFPFSFIQEEHLPVHLALLQSTIALFLPVPARRVAVTRNGLKLEKETTLMEVRWTRVTSTK